MTKRVAILISGGGSNMVTLVNAMRDKGFAEPVVVGSNDPTAGGLERAMKLGIPTFSVDHKGFGGNRIEFEKALHRELVQAAPDVVCLAGFMRVLTKDFVKRWQGRMLNIHPSLLPKYKGLNTHQRALDSGDANHGCTVHQVTPTLDDGPILGQALVSIRKGDTAQDLAERVLVQEHRLYPAVLQRFVQGVSDTVLLDARDR